MDPSPLTASTLGVIDVCLRFTRYLRNVKKTTATIDEDLETLWDVTDTVANTTTILTKLHEARLARKEQDNTFERDELSTAWQHVAQILPKCEATIQRLQGLTEEVQSVQRSRDGLVLEGFVQQLKQASREDEYLSLRRDLSNYGTILQMLLSAIQLSLTHEGQPTQDETSEDVREKFHKLNQLIQSFKPLLESGSGAKLRGAFHAVQAVASLASYNRYFDIPQSVSSIFTGRETHLEQLEAAMFDPSLYSTVASSDSTQRRFVIHGLAGSGKTQFCCKFAHGNRQRFWGVFWIDGSSEQRTRLTFSNIARSAGREPNDRAAKDWLASQKKPWLLIIDHTDNSQTDLNECFPGGEHGHILITTRNPLHKEYGTVGSGFFDFSDWEPEAAISLLLKAADRSPPLTKAVEDAAFRIAEALGYLPLPLIMAGRAIMKGLCSFQDYLSFYESNWKRMRRQAQSGGKNYLDHSLQESIYLSFELMHWDLLRYEKSQAAADAIELLNVFSFLYRENISMDLLVQSATNPRKEQAEARRQQARDTTQTRRTWSETLEAFGGAALELLFADRGRPVSPSCLRAPEANDSDFDQCRLRAALLELSQRSLIMHHPDKDSYSMHPVIHTWVRERPEMKTVDQAIWCQAAATIISQSILLPPLANKGSDENFRRDLLPHLLFMRRCKAEIREQFEKNQAERRTPLPILKSSLNRNEVVSMAKYSLVYAQCGLWKDAEDLQLVVRDFLKTNLGPQHPGTIRIQLALAGTYWQQGRGTEAADLQWTALQSCIKAFGKEHHMTFNIMDSLAVSRSMQGRYKEALALHETAIDGLTRTVGPDHEDTLRAKDHLGRVYHKSFRFEEARELHHTAAHSMKASLGPDHLDTLTAMENLAMTYFELGGHLLESAQELEQQVCDLRCTKLGKEHPHTLLAAFNLARIKAARGNFKDAEGDILRGLQIAYRNLGADHVAVLYARMYLGDILLQDGRLEEANEELTDAIETLKSLPTARHGAHPDRLMGIYILAECLRRQGRHEEGIALCEEAINESTIIAAYHHPLVGKIEERKRVLIKDRDEPCEKEETKHADGTWDFMGTFLGKDPTVSFGDSLDQNDRLSRRSSQASLRSILLVSKSFF